MEKEFQSLVFQLERQLQDHHPEWGVTELAPSGAGVDFLVLKGETKKFGPVAFRIPRSPWISHLNDPLVEARQLLQQESIIASYLAAHGLPTPQVFALCLEDDEFDFLMSAYIDSDGGVPNVFQLGELMRNIHDLPPPSLRLVMQTHITMVDSIIERLLRRSHLIEMLFQVDLKIPATVKIVETLRTHYRCTKLLHMDARAANVLAYRGTIFSIIDWGNAVIGDPAFELARIAEYGYIAQHGVFKEYGYSTEDGEVNPDFMAGYGANPLNELPDEVVYLYRLDTATMLTVLFGCVLSRPALAKHALQRVMGLYQQLNEVLGEKNASVFCSARI